MDLKVLKEDPDLEGSKFVEIVGTVADAATMKAMLVIKLSDNLGVYPFSQTLIFLLLTQGYFYRYEYCGESSEDDARGKVRRSISTLGQWTSIDDRGGYEWIDMRKPCQDYCILSTLQP